MEYDKAKWNIIREIRTRVWSFPGRTTDLDHAERLGSLIMRTDQPHGPTFRVVAATRSLALDATIGIIPQEDDGDTDPVLFRWLSESQLATSPVEDLAKLRDYLDAVADMLRERAAERQYEPQA